MADFNDFQNAQQETDVAVSNLASYLGDTPDGESPGPHALGYAVEAIVAAMREHHTRLDYVLRHRNA